MSTIGLASSLAITSGCAVSQTQQVPVVTIFDEAHSDFNHPVDQLPQRIKYEKVADSTPQPDIYDDIVDFRHQTQLGNKDLQVLKQEILSGQNNMSMSWAMVCRDVYNQSREKIIQVIINRSIDEPDTVSACFIQDHFDYNFRLQLQTLKGKCLDMYMTTTEHPLRSEIKQLMEMQSAYRSCLLNTVQTP